MLDFQLDALDFKLRCYTNIAWLREKFKQGELEFVDDREECDICIVDGKSEGIEDDLGESLKIHVEELSSVDAFISQEYIEAYLKMIEQYESEDYGMVDFNDIKAVTKGSLIEYVKIPLKGHESEVFAQIQNSFVPTEDEMGVILFASVKDLEQLSQLSNTLQTIYPNMHAVIMAPTRSVTQSDNHIEVFIFKK